MNKQALKTDANFRVWIGRGLLRFVLALPVACLICGYVPAEGQSTTADAPAHQAPPRHNRPGIEERVRTFSKEFDLDARQQSKLRKLLESQRQQIRRMWSDGSVPAGQRVSATLAINDQTADRIRALLNEEQRKKYKPPRLPHEAAAGSVQRSVEDWMNAAKPK